MKLSKIQHRIYDIIISTLAIAAAVLVLIDLSQGLNDWKKLLIKLFWLFLPSIMLCAFILLLISRNLFIRIFAI